MNLKTKEIDNVFAPSSYRVVYSSDSKGEDLMNKEKKQQEENTYKEVILGLQNDMVNLGIELTYASKIIIREVAMNIVLFDRIKLHFVCRDLMRPKLTIKPDYILSKKDYSRERNSKSISYGDQFCGEEVHPLFEKLIPNLQKQINNGLKSLGLLSSQQIERQKLTIIKKLRQRYENPSGEISIEARQEKKIRV